jgi:hypothetical protein
MTRSKEFIIIESNLEQVDSLDDLLNKYNHCFSDISFHTYINDLLADKNMKKSHVYPRTQMGRTYVYQIFADKRHPSRSKLLHIALAMKCSIEETQTLLLFAKHAPLSFRLRQDLIIAHCLYSECDIFDLNNMLYDMGEEPLFNEE